MSPPRLFSNVPLGAESRFVLDAERAHYAGRVLRLRSGDAVTVFDGSGGEYPATIDHVGKKELGLTTGAHVATEVESPLVIRLVQALVKGDRMDLIVQKATELGTARISPVVTAFTVIKLDPARAEKRQAHWRNVAISACEQCGRNRVPEIDPPQPLTTWLGQQAVQGGECLILEPGAAISLPDSPPPSGELGIVIGPEGGFNEAELAAAAAAGVRAVRLGPRILRTETAAIAALSVVLAAWGDC